MNPEKSCILCLGEIIPFPLFHTQGKHREDHPSLFRVFLYMTKDTFMKQLNFLILLSCIPLSETQKLGWISKDQRGLC